MNRTRTLSLKRETLTELTPGELGAVVGASHVGCTVTHGASLDEPCPTLPVFVCLTPKCAL